MTAARCLKLKLNEVTIVTSRKYTKRSNSGNYIVNINLPVMLVDIEVISAGAAEMSAFLLEAKEPTAHLLQVQSH